MSMNTGASFNVVLRLDIVFKRSLQPSPINNDNMKASLFALTELADELMLVLYVGVL